MRAHRATASQPSLFGDGIPSAPPLPSSVAAVFTPPPSRARATDPETSHEAAEAIRSDADRQADEVLAMLTANPGLTSRELADQYHADRYMVARRLPELRERGLVTTGAKSMVDAAFAGFKALPEKAGGVSWWRVLGCEPNASEDRIRDCYRCEAMARHPDKGGTHEAFVELQRALREGLAARGAR